MTANEIINDVTAVILAGGQSRRMGRDKRFLDLAGVALLDRVSAVLQTVFHEIVIVAASEDARLARPPARVVLDAMPGTGTLGGIYTGLLHARTGFVFAAACDMPFLAAPLIRRMAEQRSDADIVIAKLATGLQPTHALYSKACLPVMERLLRAGQLKSQALTEQAGLRVCLLEEPDARRYDPQLLSFMNLNTPADFELARKLLASKGGG
jgi:molybdopterin-guanine dinucleotide biosynthesis protein A